MMRQQNIDKNLRQEGFIQLLPRLRNGTSTMEDFNLLNTRLPNASNYIEFQNAITIFNDNDSVDQKNYDRLISKNQPITELRAINSSKKGSATSSQQFGGLCNSIYLSNDCEVTIISNIWKKKGNQL